MKTYYIHPMAFGSTQDPGHGHVPVVKADEAEKRIAELEASHNNLREAMAGIHNTIAGGGAYTPLAAILNASKRAYEESAAEAGKGDIHEIHAASVKVAADTSKGE